MKFIGEDNSYTRLLAQRNKPIPADDFTEREKFATLTIRACREFLAVQGDFHDSYTEQIKYGDEVDPKEFFIHSAVYEVFKAALSTLEWCGQVLRLAQKNTQSDPLTIQAKADAIHNQQNLSIRKLFETLLYCVLFRNTNESAYYQHLLLLIDLDQHLSRIQDKKEFFEKVSAFEIKQADEIKDEILALEATDPALAATWYLSQHDPKKRLQKTGKILTSSRDLFKKVTKQADLQLRTTIGLSYEVVFGSSSKSIHFMPSLIYSTGKTTFHDLNAHLGVQALLEQAILVECMSLSGLVPGQICRAIKNTAQSNDEFVKKAAEGLVLREFQINDYVLSMDTLLKVTEIHKGIYGLPVCFVTPLAGHLTDADWLPSSMLTLFARNAAEKSINDLEAIESWQKMRTLVAKA